MTEQLHFHFSLSCIGEGNGNPLQCSCLENLRDGGAWWAAVYGVAQSRTWLKRLSSSSSICKTTQEICIRYCYPDTSGRNARFSDRHMAGLFFKFLSVSPGSAPNSCHYMFTLSVTSSWVRFSWLRRDLGDELFYKEGRGRGEGLSQEGTTGSRSVTIERKYLLLTMTMATIFWASSHCQVLWWGFNMQDFT